MGQWTFLELAKRVLEEEKRPLTALEIWEIAKVKGYDRNVATVGQTPEKSIGALIYVNMRDKKDSPFVKTDSRPIRFYLHSLEKTGTRTTFEYPTTVSKPTYLEKHLHPFLAYYANLYLKAYVKTIRHTKSKKGGFGEWVHPDMVGCYFPMQEWRNSVIDFGNAISSTSAKLFSFEIKRDLTFLNLRESFFQAVSNSSWANEGYLVAAEIDPTDEFSDELKRLTTSFGIGAIKLDLTDPDSSQVLFPARAREVLDWEAINKLAMMNEDFESFIQGITKDINIKEIIRDRYEPILEKEELKIPGITDANTSFAVTSSQSTVRIESYRRDNKGGARLQTEKVEDTFRYTTVSSFSFKGVKHEAKHWKDVLIGVCNVMLEKHPDQFSRVLELKGQKRPWFAQNPDGLSLPERVDQTDIFVETRKSADRIVEMARAITAMFGYAQNDLKFEFTKADVKKRSRKRKKVTSWV
jgi:hypothetical protein